MGLALADFMEIVGVLTSHASWFFTSTNEAILITSPVQISLFAAFFGFVILEFFIMVLNRLRSSDQGMAGLTGDSTGAHPLSPNEYGGFGKKQYGPQLDKYQWRGGRRRGGERQ